MSSLENALKIMLLLNRSRPVLRVGEVCREIGLPKSSVSRLLKTLSDYGMIERENGDSGYVAGPRSLMLADLYSAQHALLDLVEVSLSRLTDEFGFAGYVSALTGPDIVIIRVQHGSYPLRLVREIGQPMPAYRTSVGQALLSYLDDDEVCRRARGPGENEPQDADIRRTMDRFRRYGVAWTESAIIPGIAALAVAVRDPKKDEALGFSISYPTSAVDTDMRLRMFLRIREEAHSIGGRLRDPFWAERSLQDWPIPDLSPDDH